MAEEIAYKVSVDTGSGGKSLKDLKQDFKNAQTELSGLTVGTKEYVKALEKLGGIRDNIGDLNQEINAFNPEGKVKAFGNVVGGLASGFQAATGAAALFGGQNKDIEKALLKVQAVMAFTEGIKGLASLGDGFKVLKLVIMSNPLFIIASIVIAIGVAMYALKDKIGFVGKAFDVIGEVIGYVTDKVKEFLDWIGLTNFAMTKLNDSIIENAKKAKEATLDRYDSQIAAAKREHKETVFLEIEKQKAILATNKLAIDAIGRQRDASGALNEDQLKQLTELRKQNSDAYRAISDSWATYKDKQIEKDNKAYEAYKSNLDKHIQNLKDADARADAINAEADAKDAERKAQKKQDLIDGQEAWKAAEEEQRVIEYNNAIQKEKDDKEAHDKKIARQKEEFDQAVGLAQQSTAAIGDLSNLLFDLKRRNMVKGSAQELKLAKRQFAIQKALAITNTVISTVQGMIKAIANNPPPSPIGIIGAALTGVAGTVATATIASKKFMGDGGGGDSGGGGAGSVSIPQPPTIAPPSQGGTDLNPDGTIKNKTSSQPVIKAFVVETDVTKTQKTVKQIEDKAKL